VPMKSLREFWRKRKPNHPTHDQSCDARRLVIGIVASLGLGYALVACSSQRLPQPSASNQGVQPAQSAQSEPLYKTVSDADLAGKTPNELASFVFERHGCKNCHTLGKDGKLGFTERGKAVGRNFEGCISLLTSMNVIAQEQEENRKPEEKEKAARFQQFGCTTCHQITPGKLGLTEYGTKLASLHMACTDVERILSQKRGVKLN
jgi:cytochrome c551/c552